MNITAKQIAEFRAKTGLPMMECKKALVEADGDEAKALELLKKRGMAKAASKSERATKSGLVEAYVHGGKIGVLVEVLSETDFVAKNEEFKSEALKKIQEITSEKIKNREVFLQEFEFAFNELVKLGNKEVFLGHSFCYTISILLSAGLANKEALKNFFDHFNELNWEKKSEESLVSVYEAWISEAFDAIKEMTS